MATARVITNLKHDGQRYLPGETVVADISVLTGLASAGVVEAPQETVETTDLPATADTPKVEEAKAESPTREEAPVKESELKEKAAAKQTPTPKKADK